MFDRGVQAEINRLKWANEIYEKDLTKYVRSLEEIHRLIQLIPTPVNEIKSVLERAAL